VDLLTADWTAVDRERTKSFGTCPVVWIADVVGVGSESERSEGLVPVLPGKVLGETTEASAACWGLSALQPDADGVVRRYTTHHPAMVSDSAETHPARNIALTLARGPWSASGCPSGSPPEGWERRKKIPFSANDSFRRTHAKLVLDSMDRQQQPLFETLRQGIFSDAPTVILGGAYRQARDRHRTPIGMLHGSEILANVVYTERVGREIVDVSPWMSLTVDLTIGTILLAGVTWLRLRWPWALVLSGSIAIGAALLISWGLYGYFGYFLGVFGAMCGVVLGVAVEASWDPFKEWCHELWARILAISRE
jgi:CHASE2 domain-containing sensor protein